MSRMDNGTIAAALQVLGYKKEDITDNLIEQMQVFVEAFDIFTERDPHHKSLWRYYGTEDCLLHVRSKLGRFMVDPPTHLDDGLDLLNYATFAIRLVREGMQ